MNMNLTEEQSLLKETAAKFCKAEFESEKLRHMIEHEPNGIPAALWAKIAEQGWIGVCVPEADGGLGLGATELALIMEEMGRWVAPGPFFSSAALAAPAISMGGTATAKEKWLEKIITGEAIGTLAVLEEDAQFGAAQVRTKAERKGDGWVLTGRKWFVGDLGAADVVIVAARTGAGEGDVSLFAVKKTAPGAAVELNKLTDMTSRSGQFTLADVNVTGAALLGEVNKGWDLVRRVMRIANVCLAAGSISGAERLFQVTLAYVKERRQFGVPVGSFQAVKHPLANLYADLESARSAYHYAAWTVDADAPDAESAVAVARLTCLEAFRRTTLDCLQAHGGIGFTWEYDLHFYLKRAKHNQYLLGQAEDYEEIVAREALKI